MMKADGAPRATKAATVLIVEDEVLVRMAVVEDFIQAGYSAVDAASADEALTVLEADLEVDLIFGDIHMPGALDGLALLEAVRDSDAGTRGPDAAARQTSSKAVGISRRPSGVSQSGTGSFFSARNIGLKSLVW